MSRVTARRRSRVLKAGHPASDRIEQLAGEEALEIRLGGEPLAVTMRTPGDDFDLVAGFLVSEGLITKAADLSSIRYARSPQIGDENRFNVVDVTFAGSVTALAPRRVVTTSACGVCGTTSIDQVRRTPAFAPLDPSQPRWGAECVEADLLRTLPERLRQAQTLFDRTGGVHAAGLFTTDGAALCVREDVGRHNAVDKVVGWALREERLPLRGTVLQVSGRASFELVQKAAMAGIGTLAAVSAPSSLAADLAESLGLTLAGFNRGDRVTVYTGAERITGD